MSRHSLLMMGLGALAALSACTQADGVGGLTADIVFSPQPGLSRHALRTAAPPMEVGRLEIAALDTAGSTLAVTVLALEPGPGELPLAPGGGTWTLDAVPAGTGRVVRGRAYYRSDLAPGFEDVLAYEGRIENVEVKVGGINKVGTLTLNLVNRVPEADLTGPSSPQVSALPLPEGEAIRVTFTPPPEPDLAGFVLAVATASAANSPPLLDRGAPVAVGSRLAEGIEVHSIWPFDSTEIVTVQGLIDNVAVGVLVYAFDADRNGNPLNFSPPGQALVVPTDSSAPGAPTGLTAVATGPDSVQIEFTAPAEDGPNGGAPAQYELRAATTALPLQDPALFAGLPALEPPPVAAPGSVVRFERSFAQLGAAGTPLFIGLRAVDAAANPGPAGVAEVVANATLTPSLTAVSPPIALAGREVVIAGRAFGTQTGTVTLAATETGTVTVTLNVSRWTDRQIVASVPTNARTGRLTVRRPDGAFADIALSVVARIPDQVQDQVFPFEFIGTGQETPPVAALYREDGEFGPYTAAVDRIFDATAEGTPFGPLVQTRRSTWIAGTYSPAHDRFMFVASNELLSMTSVLVSSSTIAPDPFRVPIAVTAGQADRVSVLITAGGLAGEVPAMLAFTVNGTLRTATVADARFQPFDGFYATTSTVQQYERVTMGKKRDGTILMAHRTVTGTVSVLTLRDNPAGLAPNQFTARPTANPPSVGRRFEILAAPLTAGGTERFLIAYEHLLPDGTTQVRLLWADDFGQRLGLAPLPPGDRRLDDVGLVLREGQVYVALASARIAGSAELTYTEVPLSAIGDPAAVDGAWPGVVMDTAPDDHYARLGCKPFLQATCPIVWMGDDFGVLFQRR